ncbi:MAG: GntR family transcriptional regulator [bacterium]|nr:GntR family transcriptional regulator [bacterium]
MIDLTLPTETGKKTHELVAEELRRRIVSGELAVGEQLPPEDELNQLFGIARTTLREALRVLESQGLIEVRRGRGGGPVVTKPDLDPTRTALAIALQLEGATVGDLTEVRMMIEPSAAGKLAHRHTEADLDALSAAIQAAHIAAEANDTAAFGQAAARVHETLIERSANSALTIISQLLHELVSRYYEDRAAVTPQRMMRRAVRSYRALVDYIEDGDVVGATEHWRGQMAFTSRRTSNEVPITFSA